MNINYMIKWVVVKLVYALRFPFTQGKGISISAIELTFFLLLVKDLQILLSGGYDFWLVEVLVFAIPAFIVSFVVVLITRPYYQIISCKIADIKSAVRYWYQTAEKDVAGGRKHKRKNMLEEEDGATAFEENTPNVWYKNNH